MSFTWPNDTILPPPSIDLGHRSNPPVIRTSMESGRVRQRKRFTKGWRYIPVSWVFTDEEFEIFQAIVEHKLSAGADYFEMELPLGGGFGTNTVRIVEGSWDSKYVPHMHWRVTATLECDNLSPMSEAALDAILTPP